MHYRTWFTLKLDECRWGWYYAPKEKRKTYSVVWLDDWGRHYEPENVLMLARREHAKTCEQLRACKKSALGSARFYRSPTHIYFEKSYWSKQRGLKITTLHDLGSINSMFRWARIYVRQIDRCCAIKKHAIRLPEIIAIKFLKGLTGYYTCQSPLGCELLSS